MSQAEAAPAHRGLAVVADDFGLSDGICAGIVEAIAAGRVTGTSVMTTCSGPSAWSGELAKMQPRADIGLHLNLTYGQPLDPASPLLHDNELPSPARLYRALLRADVARAALTREIALQLDAFADRLGRGPDFIDGHQHVHAFPVVRTVLADLLHERSLVGRVWVRDSADRISRILRRGSALPHALALAAVARKAGKRLRRGGVATNDGFSGVSDLKVARDIAAEFGRFLVAPGPRHLLMVHPGRATGLDRSDGHDARRQQELAFLLSDAWPRLLHRAGLVPRRFHNAAPPPVERRWTQTG